MKFITSDMKAIAVLVAIIMAVALLIVVWHDTRSTETGQTFVCSNNRQTAETETIALCPGSEWSFTETEWANLTPQ